MRTVNIIFLDVDKYCVECLEKYFGNEINVRIVHSELCDFLSNNQIECVVSPANSFGLMDGGYDLALTEYFGDQMQKRVQQYIASHYYGEQPVGTSFIVDAGKDGCKLIHTPSMRIPCEIKDPLVIYQCMRTTLMCAIENDIKSILIPMFGSGVGGIDADDAAKFMWLAYQQLSNPSPKNNWEQVFADERFDELL